MNRKLYIVGFLLLALTVLLSNTDPRRIPPFLLVLPFIIIFAILFNVVLMILDLIRTQSAENKKLAGLCAGLPSLLLILQSIGQLTARDVLIIIVLFVVSYFYILKTAISK